MVKGMSSGPRQAWFELQLHIRVKNLWAGYLTYLSLRIFIFKVDVKKTQGRFISMYDKIHYKLKKKKKKKNKVDVILLSTFSVIGHSTYFY